MAASVVRWVSAGQAVGTSKPVDISTVGVGESMIVLHNIGSTTVTLTAPAGWEPLFVKTTMGSRACAGHYKTKTSDTETLATFTASASTGWSHALIGVLGALPATWIIGPVWTRTLHGTSFTNVIDGVTTTGPNAVALALSFEATSTAESPNTISGVNNGFTELGYLPQGTAIETIWAGTKAMPTAGDVGDTTVTYRNTQASNGAGIMLAFPEGAHVPVGSPVVLGDGSAARLSYIDSEGNRAVPASVRLLKPGFPDAAAYVATPGATMAHRGGSESFPDMSEYAYDQAILRGFGALEFSAQRTSDGWWFGCHNPDINEVAGTTGLPNVSAMTRAQVEAYANVDNATAGHPSRPFYGLVEFLEKYGQTHVLMMDPKNAISFNTEFMTICESIVSKDRLMWKYYLGGVGSSNPTNGAAAAMSRGWAGTWGYCYNEDVDSGAFAEHSGNAAWTTLGINIGAAQSYWDTVLAVGKPVIGHIANSQADYDTAMAKGADMVQCADTTTIKSVSI
jgi:hypothetical protein